MLAISGSVLAQRYQIDIVPGSIADRLVSALRDGRRVNIESRTLQVRTIDRSDAIAVYELVLFREPATGQFVSLASRLRGWFGAQAMPGDLAANTVIGFDGDAMVAFSYGRLSLLIRRSKTRDATMAVGQARVLAIFSDYLQSHEGQPLWSEDDSWVALSERLPKGLTGHVADPPPTRLRDLTRSGGCWRMVVDGPMGESTPVALDDNYNLSSTETCSPLQPRFPRVQFVPGAESLLRAPAIRSNGQTTIELHYGMARIAFPDGLTHRLSLHMLYDPDSQLFWWNAFELHRTQPDSYVETDARQFLNMSVYIAKDRMVVFSTGYAQESTERYPGFQAAQSHVLSVLEAMHGNIDAWRGPPFHALDMSGIPRDFFHQCMHAEMGPMRLTSVAKTGELWQLTLSGVNGHSAVVSLQDNYEAVSTKLSPEVPPPSIELVRSETVAAQRDGEPVKLDLREAHVRHPFDCVGQSIVTRVVLIFDPSSHSSWWTRLDSAETFNPAIYVTRDSIVVFSIALPSLKVRESGIRSSNWSDLQSHVADLLWRGFDKGYYHIDLSKHLPEEFFRRPPAGSLPPAPPRISRKNGLWQILVMGTNGQTAAVQLDSEYNFVDATLRP